MGKSQNPRDYPRLLGIWNSKISTRWCWDSWSLGLSQTFRSLRLKNKPYCVRTLGLWDSPKVPVLSQVIGRLRLKYNPHGVWILGLWDSRFTDKGSNDPGSNDKGSNDTGSNDKGSKTRQRVKRQRVQKCDKRGNFFLILTVG